MSCKNFTWSILEYFVRYALTSCRNNLRKSRKRVTKQNKCKQNAQKIFYDILELEFFRIFIKYILLNRIFEQTFKKSSKNKVH